MVKRSRVSLAEKAVAAPAFPGDAGEVDGRPVAVARCRASTEAQAGDLYPDPDLIPVTEALARLDVNVVSVSWDDPAVCWDDFEVVVISSTWDSVDRPDEYLAWATDVSARTRLANPFPALRWGLDKTHQLALAGAGISIIPTRWVPPGQPWAPPGNDYVIKPAVSAGGRSTARYHDDGPAARAHVDSLHGVGQTVMVQPYVASIDTEGETDLIYLGGIFSHAVRKLPALSPGRGVIDRPWEQMAWSGTTTPTPAQLTAADHVVAEVERLTGARLTYARVDLVSGEHGEPLLLEVEIIDPYLSLDLVPEAGARLAEALLSR